MRKFIPFLFCGFAALSYSAIAADTSVDAEAQKKAQSGMPDNAVSEKKGNEAHGATTDSHKQNPKADKQAKRKQKDESGAGSTTGERRN